MGQKVHPYGLRLGIIRQSRSTWFAEGAKYREQLVSDLTMRRLIDEQLENANVSNVTISSSTGHGGDTDYSLQVEDGTWVVLTAPETVVSTSDGYEYQLLRWWYLGYPFYYNYIAFEMSGNTPVCAEYERASAGTANATLGTDVDDLSPLNKCLE